MLSKRKKQIVFDVGIPVAFHSDITIGNIYLQEIAYEKTKNRWDSFIMKLRVSNSTYMELEKAEFFHNEPQNRLTTVEGGVNPNLDVYMEIILEKHYLHHLPPIDTNLNTYFNGVSKHSELFKEIFWDVRFVWTEIRLGAAIGGGVIKVGYKTIFSPPEDPVDLLKRRGVVSAAIVTALIENNIPVFYNNITNCFEFDLRVDHLAFKISIEPNEELVGFSLKIVYSDIRIPMIKESLTELMKNVNEEIYLGELSLQNEHLIYLHTICIPKELVSHQWATETLLAGVGLIYNYIKEHFI